MNSIKTFMCRPVERHSAQDRHLQEATYSQNGRILEKKMLHRTKAVKPNGDSVPDILQFRPHDTDYNRYVTGLDELIPNPWKVGSEEEIGVGVENLISEYRLADTWRSRLPKILKQESITKQLWGEIRFGLLPDELTDRKPTTKPTKDNPDVRTRIQKTKAILYDRNNPFCEDNLEGWLKIHLLKNRPDIVAWPHTSTNGAIHNWYLIEASEDQKLSTSTNLLRNKAISRLVNLQEKYPVTSVLEENPLYFIASIIEETLNRPLVKGKMNAGSIDDKLNTFLNVKTKAEVEINTKKFDDAVDLFEKNPTLFYAKYLVRQALNVNVVQINNASVYWVGKQDNLEWYKFTSIDAFITAIYGELDKIESPILDEFILLLSKKGIVIPTALSKE